MHPNYERSDRGLGSAMGVGASAPITERPAGGLWD
jgi:hypothetical protein